MNHLRIGNIVAYTKIGVSTKIITAIKQRGIVVNDGPKCKGAKFIKYEDSYLIMNPLNSVWLKRFNLHSGNVICFTTGYCCWVWGYTLYIKKPSKEVITVEDVTTVDRLQNIVFYITGRELNINW